MKTDVVAEVQERIQRDFSARVERSTFALGSGFRISNGVEIPLVLSPDRDPSRVRLSDAGEAWMGMVSDGFTDSRPSKADARKLADLCRLFGVNWAVETGEIYQVARLEEVADAARRVISAALALDGWRAWYPPVGPRALSEARLSESVTRVAQTRGWYSRRKERVEGQRSGVERVSSLMLHDAAAATHRRAAVEFTSDSPSNVLDHVAGWFADTDVPLVVVAPQKAVDEVVRVDRWRSRIAVVPRVTGRDVSTAVVDAAQRIAA